MFWKVRQYYRHYIIGLDWEDATYSINYDRQKYYRNKHYKKYHSRYTKNKKKYKRWKKRKYRRW